MSQKPMTKTQLVANLAEATGSDKVTEKYLKIISY